MRLVTFTAADGASRVGALDGADRVVDLAHALADLLGPAEAGGAQPFIPPDMIALLRRGDAGMDDARRALCHSRETGAGALAVDAVRLRSPLPRPTSIRDFMLVEEHVLGSFSEVPAAWYDIPVYWKGNADAVFGPDDPIRWPVYTTKLDFELELAAVIGRPARAVGVDEALSYVAGYTVFNDWSARDIQMREMTVGLGPGLGKDFATSIGPCLTTPDEIDPAGVAMTARVNGEVWSSGSLGSMRFSFAQIISHLSAEQELQPGDVIASGTIAQGCGLELDRWIQVGDVVELEVEGIGVLRNVIEGPDESVARLVLGASVPEIDQSR